MDIWLGWWTGAGIFFIFYPPLRRYWDRKVELYLSKSAAEKETGEETETDNLIKNEDVKEGSNEDEFQKGKPKVVEGDSDIKETLILASKEEDSGA